MGDGMVGDLVLLVSPSVTPTNQPELTNHNKVQCGLGGYGTACSLNAGMLQGPTVGPLLACFQQVQTDMVYQSRGDLSPNSM